MTVRITRPTQNYNRTLDYRFTVSDKNDPAVAELKKSVADHNKHVRAARRKGFDWADGTCKIQRVRIKPRGPRNSSRYHTMTADATHFDIYVGLDTENEYRLKQEIETGLRPGELRKLQAAQYLARDIECIGKMRKRGEEVPQWLLNRI